LRHQSQLVFAGNGRRMNLNELTIRILRALLITRRDGAAGTDHRVRRFTEDQTRTTSGDNHSVSGKRLELECLQVHRDQSTTNLMIVEHQRHHFPVFKLSDFTADFVSANLFVESVEKLLARRRTGKGSAVMFSATKTTKVEQAFRRSREGNTHAVEQVND